MSPSLLMVLAGVLYSLHTVLRQGVTRPQCTELELEEPPRTGAVERLKDAWRTSGLAEQNPPLQDDMRRELEERMTAEGGRTAVRTDSRGRRMEVGPGLMAAETTLKATFRTDSYGRGVSARDGYGSSSYGGGSSLETALLTLAFLTFAVFVIQNLQNIIMLLTGGGGGGRSARGPHSSLYEPEQDDDTGLYDLDMVTEITHQFMAALYKYSHP